MKNTKSIKTLLSKIIQWFKNLLGTNFEKEIEKANIVAANEITVSSKSAGKILPEIGEEKPIQYIKGRFSKEEIIVIEKAIKGKNNKEVDWEKLSQKLHRKTDALKAKAKMLRNK